MVRALDNAGVKPVPIPANPAVTELPASQWIKIHLTGRDLERLRKYGRTKGCMSQTEAARRVIVAGLEALGC